MELNTLKQSSEKGTAVVYGLYDPSAQPFMVKVQDFFIERRKISVKERSYFFHLLATMLNAGIPIVRALKILTKKTDHERFRRIINTLAYDVERGRKLSESMARFPEVFKESEIGIVRSGEAIGNLDQILFRLAKQSSRMHGLYTKMRGAMVYPATVLVALLISGAIVITIVIPRLNEFFVQGGFEMPFLTRAILYGGQFFIQFFWLIAIFTVLLILIVSFYINTEEGRMKFDRWSLQIPLIHQLVRKYNIARLVQIFSLLVESGVPIHEAITISAGAIENRLYKDFMFDLRKRIEEGQRISESMAEAPFLFPETVVAMISVGERTGQLGIISDKLAEHYEEEVEHSLENLTTIMEPVIIVFVGIAVAIFALALLGPIFSLSSLVA